MQAWWERSEGFILVSLLDANDVFSAGHHTGDPKINVF
jgi:hypothetical protein